MKNRKPTGHEETWPPQPPWGRNERTGVFETLLGLVVGIPVLLGTMLLILIEDLFGRAPKR